MSRTTERGETSYQQRLRKLGAFLDAAYARFVVVGERPNGFAVRYERQDMESIFLQRFIPYDELHRLRRGDLRLRRTWMRRLGRRLHGVGGEPGGYQDLFRALGFVLDQAQASSVHVVEHEDGGALVVSYSAHHAPQNHGDPQRVMVLGVEEREELRRSAKARRGHEGLPTLSSQ